MDYPVIERDFIKGKIQKNGERHSRDHVWCPNGSLDYAIGKGGEDERYTLTSDSSCPKASVYQTVLSGILVFRDA